MEKNPQLPFPIEQVGHRQYKVYLDPFWETARDWAKREGFPKEQGKYQGTPPI